MTYQEFLRRKRLHEIYAGLSEQDKMILTSLNGQQRQLDEVLRRLGKHPFATDLLANIGGNFITDGLIWLGGKLLKKL